MIGQTLGHYRIQEKIGQGGMGVVYRARDERLKRDVALKVLPADTLADESARARLLREAQTASALNHPHICTIYEVDEADGQAYIAMERVEGRSLKALVGHEGLPVEMIIRYGAQIADALAHAHRHGIIHRDLKSSNVAITPDGQAKVLDFGLARRLAGKELDEATQSRATLAEAGAVAGTLHYMAPEVLRGEPVDARSDIWTLGVLLYEMAAGMLPFKGHTGYELSAAILRESPAPLTSRLPAGLRGVIQRCLAKDPGQRYQQAGEVRAALEAVQSDSAAAPASAPLVPAEPRWGLRWWPLGVLGAVTVLLGVFVGLNVGGWRQRLLGREPAQRIESLAVLPLANLSGDPEQEYFADGMTDALITDLSKIGALKVISRTSVMRYKHTQKPLPEIARELNVDGIVEGSVERVGNKVRISAQLIRASTDQHLWAEAYERDLRDVLVLRDEVARSIAQEIQVKLTPKEHARLASARQVDPEAYQLYLKGRYFWVKRTRDSIDKAIGYLRQAIDRDPGYAAAYSGLADCYSSLGFSFDVGSMAPSDVQPKAMAAVKKAIELDESLAEAHSSLAFIKLNYEWDWRGSETEFKRGIELNPGWANGHHWYAHNLISAGRLQEAETESKRALELDQLSPIMNVHLGWHYYFARQYEKSLEQLQKTLELDPNYGLAYWYRGWDYEQKGMYADALREMRKAKELLRGNLIVDSDIAHVHAVSGDRAAAEKVIAELKQLSSQHYVNPFEIALIYVGLGQKNEAFGWLDRAYRERSDMLVYLKVDPRLDPIRSEPRFSDLVRRVGIP